jgi:hypothetical protein
MAQRITQIPLPGNSGQMPTGAIQFQDDWPGLWIRGDTAIPLSVGIRGLQQRLSGSSDPIIFSVLAKLGEVADIIERDVIVR